MLRSKHDVIRKAGVVHDDIRPAVVQRYITEPKIDVRDCREMGTGDGLKYVSELPSEPLVRSAGAWAHNNSSVNNFDLAADIFGKRVVVSSR